MKYERIFFKLFRKNIVDVSSHDFFLELEFAYAPKYESTIKNKNEVFFFLKPCKWEKAFRVTWINLFENFFFEEK